MQHVSIPRVPTPAIIEAMCRAQCVHDHMDPDHDDGGQPLWNILEDGMRVVYAAVVARAEAP